MTLRTITIPEAAEVLGVHKSTAYDWAERGALPVVASGLVAGCQWVVRVEDLAVALEQQWGGVAGDWRQYIRSVAATRQERIATERLRKRGIGDTGDMGDTGGMEGHNP